MPAIYLNLKRSVSKRMSYVQTVIVFIAFGLMVTASYLFIVNNEKSHLEREALIMAEQIESQLYSDIMSVRTMLVTASEAVSEMISQGVDFDTVGAYIVNITEHGHRLLNTKGFRGVYAMFDIFGGRLFSGNAPDLDWSRIENYNASTRPWYISAAAARGAFTVTDPYIDIVENTYVIAIVYSIYDSDNNRLGILWIPVLLDSLREFYDHGLDSPSNDWLLISNDFTILSHYDDEIIGLKMQDVQYGAMGELAGKLERGEPVVGQTIVNHLGEIRTLTFRQIYNGWYLGVSTLTDNYQSNINEILLFLSIVGFAFSVGLSAILMRTHSAKRKAERRTEKLLASMDIIVIITDLENDTILFVNEAMKRAFGFDDGVIGKKCWQVLFADATGRCDFCPKHYADKYSDDSFTWDFHYPPTNKDYKVVGRFIDWPDGSKVLLAQYDDITELKRSIVKIEKSREELKTAYKAAEAANIAKSTFLANMSHEIRTPMNAIIGMTTIGKSVNDDERKAYCFDKIENASKHLLGVINDILDMSKIEAGKLELSYDEFDFENMLQRVINIIAFKADEKKQKLAVHIDKSIPHSLIGDNQRLAQVITNLLGNAIKFTPEGGLVKLDTRFVGEENGEYTIKITVKDNGIGISKEKHKYIFNSFYQAETGITREFGGTGLGLVISKNIVELMGGQIWLESELGKGSEFSFTFKAKRGTKKIKTLSELGVNWDNISVMAVDDDKETLDYLHGSFKGKRILLADDLEINREIVIALLEPTGVEIDCAENGIEAVQTFEESDYDLILMDVQMPKMDGYMATQKIRESKRKTAKTVPIIAMTANVFREDIEKCLEAGMNGHVGKPLNVDELLGVLENIS